MPKTIKTRSGRVLTLPTPAEDAAITAAANADPDAVPFTDAEWAKVKPLVRRGRPLGSGTKTQATKRHATMKAMLEQMKSPDFQQALAEVEKAEQRRDVAKGKLARRRELLGAAPSFGSCKNLEDTESAVSVAEAELEKAEESIRVMRGDCSESYPSSKPQDTTPRPAPEETAGPLPLTTSDIAFCFDGLRWTELKWKKPLGDKPKWLQSCVTAPAHRGVSETRWNPVLIGAALVHNGHVQARSVRAKFQTNPLLVPWLEAWKTYEADNFETP